MMRDLRAGPDALLGLRELLLRLTESVHDRRLHAAFLKALMNAGLS